MKRTKTFLYERARRMMLAWLLCVTGAVHAQSTSFSFTLDEPSKTSAGIYDTNGVLIRTLWSKVWYPAGTNTAIWNAQDDNSNAAAPGTYQIKLLQHNTEYVWDGAIGNTSTEKSGPTVHQYFEPIQGMTIAGTNTFVVAGYDEAHYAFHRFLTTDPQHVKNQWFWSIDRFGNLGNHAGDIYDLDWWFTAADSNIVYFACVGTVTNNTRNAFAGCIVAANVSDNSLYYFSNGVVITNNVGHSLPNGVYVGTQPGISGLSVQSASNLLAVSVAPDNKVYLMDKRSGAPISNFTVSSPGRLNFSSDGSLWVCSSNEVIQYTNINFDHAIRTIITNLSEPLDVAINPNNPDIVLVADGGSSQQVKAFDTNGAALWTYGLAGGYQSNGIAVATNKFWFSCVNKVNGATADQTFLCYAPDGSFWVGDEQNHRSLHFSATQNYIEQIMYQPESHAGSVDVNNPSRVFNEFLEFKVDYTKPLSQSWTLVNNWRANADTNLFLNSDEGFNYVTTLTNGRTYALLATNNASELIELTTNGIRFTGIYPMATNLYVSGYINANVTLEADGSTHATPTGFNKWFVSTLAGFDSSNNPVWNPETLLATSTQNTGDPVQNQQQVGGRSPISSNNVLLVFDPTTANHGMHLGGVKVGGTNFLWKTSPTGPLDGFGHYDVTASGLQDGGNTVQAIDRQVVYGYNGEGWNSAQAGQYMHYYDDGLFVGQFGESSYGHSPDEGALPAFAGNGFYQTFVKGTNGEYYIWSNDESAHGPQRWHLVNARNIREQLGYGTLGSNMALTNQAYDFPTGLTGKSGNQSVQLFWQAVTGASSYNIYYSTNDGLLGTLLESTTNLTYTAQGLINGQVYYFKVAAVNAGVEETPSEQISSHPFDTTQTVLLAGSEFEGVQNPYYTQINYVTNLSNGQASYVGSGHSTAILNLRELDDYGHGNLWNESVGTKGYVIYDWGGYGTNLMNVATNFTVATGSGWSDVSKVVSSFQVNNVSEAANALSAGPNGIISIVPADNNFHFLTVFSPNYAFSPRNYTLGITPTNGLSVQYLVNDNSNIVANSYGQSQVFQFLFKGNITLWASSSTSDNATVQAIFLDDVIIPLLPPSQFRIRAP